MDNIRALSPKSPSSFTKNADAGDIIKDTSGQAFIKDVVEASLTVPVVVDFWAPWCGPCKQLTPLLEKLILFYGGKLKLVKVNIDENQMIARQLGIQSVPTIFIFHRGQPVDGFAGALPESQLRALFDRLAGGAPQASVEEGLKAAQDLLVQAQFGEAYAAFEALAENFPDNASVMAGVARSLLGLGEVEAVKALLAELPEALRTHVEIAGVQTALALAEEMQVGAGDEKEMEARLAKNPDDHEARLELAGSLFARGAQEEAIEALIELLRRDREWKEQAARNQLVKLFDALGASHPLTLKGRRKMSAVYFS